LVDFHDNEEHSFIAKDSEGHWFNVYYTCSSCGRVNVYLVATTQKFSNATGYHPIMEGLIHKIMVWPRGSARKPCPPEVPKDIASDYNEACLVLPYSPKASAALSRRCLQNLLRTAGKLTTKSKDLIHEINEVVSRGDIPSHISESIDSIRQIGNFSAHPIKSTNTGEILDVEPHEAEWTLDVLETLFDFYFVQPAILAAKKAAFNAKLAEAGKPAMK
jgi:hypothetical protein